MRFNLNVFLIIGLLLLAVDCNAAPVGAYVRIGSKIVTSIYDSFSDDDDEVKQKNTTNSISFGSRRPTYSDTSNCRSAQKMVNKYLKEADEFANDGDYSKANLRASWAAEAQDDANRYCGWAYGN